MDVKEVLIQARELISDERRWTVRSLARDKYGNSVPVSSPGATCWCSAGALSRVILENGNNDATVYTRIKDLLRKAISGESYVAFNDSRTHEEVLKMFDKAIELASTKG